MSSLGYSFRRLWSASLITNLADGVVITAAPLLAVSLTTDPVLISALGAFVMLPWLLLAIPIGVIVDRFDRRYLIAGANSTRFLVAAAISLSISTHTITIYWLFLATFIIGICEVTADTSAQALIPQILDKSQYERGNSRLQISETIVQGFVGTPISGFLYAVAIYLPFVANSLGYLVAAFLTLSIPHVARVSLQVENKETFVDQMKFGVKFLYNEKNLLRLVLMTASISFFFALATSTQVLFILKELHLSKSLFGIVLAIQGIGAVSGGFITPKLSRNFGREKVLASAIVLNAFLIFLQTFSPNIYFFTALGTLGAFTISNWNVLLMATYQDNIPTHLYGRIHGTRRTLVWGVAPIGSILGGVLAHNGLRIPLFVGGLCASAIAISSINFLLRFAKVKVS